MNETQKRIRAYKNALPGLKERVMAVALLLVLSASMMTSATFAWITLSRAPEVSNVSTTVAANGNLEIALVNPEGEEPEASKVGDSSATDGQSVVNANLTWGNLVNLSDPSYGLENLTLRPAQLNTVSLLESPLYGAVYGQDGRISQLTSNFGYTTWVPEADGVPGYFGASEDYGVRAISSTKIIAQGAEQIYYQKLDNVDALNRAAGSKYTSIAGNSKYMQSLATMMGLYMTARMDNDGTYANPTCDIADIESLRDMYALFLEAFDAEADALAELLNLQLFLQLGEGNYEPFTREKVYSSTTSSLNALAEELTATTGLSVKLQISELEQFNKDHRTIASDLEKLKALCTTGGTLAWKDSGLNQIVNNLVNVGECTMGDGRKINNIGVDEALGYLDGTQEAIITNGILYNFEKRTGAYIDVKNMSIKVSIKRSFINTTQAVTADVHTNAKDLGYTLFNNDLNYAKSLNTGDYKGGVLSAEDTYGLAIDLWVRTNAAGSYLTLEGNVITKSEDIRATGKDINGATVELYTVSQTSTDEDGNTVSYTRDLYQTITKSTDEEGNEVEVVTWYDANTHALVTEEDLGDATPNPKMTELVTVIGYEGENRVWNGAEWDDNDQLSSDATTQGSGSCYVYYADTPEDQAQSLKLLEAFNVAFVDDKGTLLATAVMDTERYYAASGRVIVPLVLSTSNSITITDALGKELSAITPLEQNVATRITAIVYLDGTKLSNSDVLAAADIQGQLNIQFGNSIDMKAVEDEKLLSEVRSVSAEVDVTEFDFDTATGPMTSNVTLNIEGSAPSTVTAFFVRKINSSQGSREEQMTFEQNEDGTWSSSYTFTSPGNYELRTVRLDGVDYDLANPPMVTVKGFTVKSLDCPQTTIMSAASSYTVNLKLAFAEGTDANVKPKMPSKVQGRFLREDGSAVNVDFKLDPTTQIWSGSATFLTSGTYTMQYLLLDGEYTELPENLIKTLTLNLGMRVAVYTTSPWEIKYVPSEMQDNEKVLTMQVKIMDNTGKELPGQANVKLAYAKYPSSVTTQDVNLTWDGKYYTGEMPNPGPGTWVFSTVKVGENALSTATTSPTFTIRPPDPPEYYTNNTVTYQYKPNNDAIMNAQITYSSAAQVQGYIIKDGAEEGTWVTGKMGDEFTNADGESVNHWSFAVPKDANGYQDGNWTLTKLHIWGVYAEDGSEYTEEEPMELAVTDTNKTKVVSRVVPTFATDKSTAFGKDASGNVTATFMTEHTISGLSVNIKDYLGGALVNEKGELLVSNVQLKFTYVNGSSVNNGGYASDSLTNATAGATIVVPLTVDDNDKTLFKQIEDVKILYAGNYITTLTYQVSGVGQSYSSSDEQKLTNMPVLSVWSKAPTVTITDVTPDNTYAVDTNTTGTVKDTSKRTVNRTVQDTDCNGNDTITTYYNHTWTTNAAHKTGYKSSISADGLTATVYFQCVHANDATYSGGSDTTDTSASNERYHAYYSDSVKGAPTVTLTLNDLSGFTSATLNFSDSTRIYTRVTYTGSGLASNGTWETTGDGASYSWTSSGTSVTRYIGYMWSQKARWGDEINATGTKTPAGTITAETLTVVYNGVTYTFNIAKVTINNPH